MFNFKNLKDSYLITVQHVSPNDEVTSYSAIIDLEAKRIEKKIYQFTLLKRRNILIDDTEPDIGSDIMMKEIGDSLYPIQFTVADTGGIIDLTNFNQIKERWSNKRKELLEKYETFEFEQYLKASAHNMDTKEQFLEVLQRDLFIHFYFLSFDQDIAEFYLCHFPLNGYKTDYYAVTNNIKDQYLIHPVFAKENILKTDGKLLYKRTKEGDLVNMKLRINMLMKDQTYYRRRVSINKDESVERLINLWF